MESSNYKFGCITKSDQGIFCFPKDDNAIGNSLLSTGIWGLNELTMLKKVIREDDEILILGAHIGTLAIPLARVCKSVHAVEANPDIYKFLLANIKLNELKNIIPHQFAASDRIGTVEFISVTGNTGGSKIAPKKYHPHYYSEIKSIHKVRQTTIDEFLPDIEPRLVFIDIEGSEYLALKGMYSCLQKAEIVFVEYIPYHLEYVAGISPEEFSAEIEKNFNYLYIPGLNIFVEKINFKSVLRKMYDAKHSEDQIIFSKELIHISNLYKNEN
ncbi:MAG: FkbM family methyltransferase [Limnohabitans sp.]|nr:FkbM family methyltransferase [Limnohabitans sp.]